MVIEELLGLAVFSLGIIENQPNFTTNSLDNKLKQGCKCKEPYPNETLTTLFVKVDNMSQRYCTSLISLWESPTNHLSYCNVGPLLRSPPSSSCQVTTPPSFMIQDYFHARVKDLQGGSSTPIGYEQKSWVRTIKTSLAHYSSLLLILQNYTFGNRRCLPTSSPYQQQKHASLLLKCLLLKCRGFFPYLIYE